MNRIAKLLDNAPKIGLAVAVVGMIPAWLTDDKFGLIFFGAQFGMMSAMLISDYIDGDDQ